jgi:hypothetical protein
MKNALFWDVTPSYIFDSCHPDDGGDTILRNVGSYKSHTAHHPRGRVSAQTSHTCHGQMRPNPLVATGFESPPLHTMAVTCHDASREELMLMWAGGGVPSFKKRKDEGDLWSNFDTMNNNSE